MEYLPLEVISHIIDFLPTLEDRKAASLVSKLWYEAYQSPAFRHHEVVHIHANEVFDALFNLNNPDRKYYHVVARGIDVTKSNAKFWSRFGPHIKSLSILSCDVREKAFVDVITSCQELESFTIQDCRSIFISGCLLEDDCDRKALRERFSRLKSLNLGYNRYLSDAIFVKFTSMCDDLEALSIPGCHISFHSGLYRKFYSKNGHSVPSETVLTFPVIFDFIQSHTGKIRELSFNETLIDSDAVSAIAQTNNLSLEALYLRRCLQLTNDGVVKLSNHQVSLVHLDLSYCPRITDLSLLIICSRMNKIKTLSVQGCRAVTDLGISELWRLAELTRLNISECELIRDEGILSGLCRRRNSKLEQLYLSHLGDLSDDAILELVQFAPNLRVLDLGYCYGAVTDKAVQCIFTNLEHLTELTLTMCDGVTDRGLTGLALKFALQPKPQTADGFLRIPLGSKAELTIIRDARIKHDVQEICESAALTSDLSGCALSNLKHLRRLNVSGCNRISDVSLKYAFKLGDLRSLDLSGCSQVTADGLLHLCANNRAIEKLKLDNCDNVNDEGVHHIVKNLNRLKRLTLGSKQVTDRSVDFFVSGEASALTYLDVRHCPQLSSAAVGLISDSNPQLQVLHSSSLVDEQYFTTPPPPPPPPPPPFN